MSSYIHGSTDAREIARLEKQASFVAPWWLPALEAAPGMRVLDLGTGIGAMADQIARRFPGVILVGVDRSEAQLAVARARHPVAEYVLGDAANLPFEDASFDRVHASWLLEHVRDPLAILREVRRVLREGGSAHFVEVDNATLETEPRVDAVHEVFAALDCAQLEGGGDPYVGRKLHELFRAAGFREIDVRSLPLVGDARDPSFFRDMIEEFAEILASVDEALGPELQAKIEEAARHLRALAEEPNGAIRYAPTLARGVR